MNISIQNILGDSNNAYMMMEIFRGASNVILTDNSEFTREDFSSIFPVFKLQDGTEIKQDEIPTEVYNLFYNMANKSLKYDRFKSQWKYCMCLYIAHYMTLFLMTQNGDPGAQAALSGALPRGIASSKSIDGLSISYDIIETANDHKGYGTRKYTNYGQQLATITKKYGHG